MLFATVKTVFPRDSKKTSNLARASLVLTLIVLFSSPFLKNFILMTSLLGLAAILGITALTIIVKSKRTIAGLRQAVFGIVLSLSLLVYSIIGYYVHALTVAIENGDIQKIEKLIAKGFDVNAASGGGQNMLTLAFRYGLRKISLFGDSREISLMTPEEVEAKILEILEVLTDNSADMNVLDEIGWAPIHYAAERNQIRIVKMLIERGADVKLKNRSGSSPLNFAAGHPCNSEMVEILIANGANVNIKDAYGNTPLHDSVYSGGLKIVETLIKNGAEVNAKNKDGKTPLKLAVEDNRKEVAELLRQHGAQE